VGKKLKSKFNNEDDIGVTDDLYNSYMTGVIKCGAMAFALRALLINNSEHKDMLTLIGDINSVRVWKFKYIDHAFVGIKNFYEEPRKTHLFTQKMYLTH
jgi:hypothetical protein